MAMAQNNVYTMPFGGGFTVIGNSWSPFFEDKTVKAYLNLLSTAIEEERKNDIQVFPLPENIFTWTWACSFNDVKVVILGQDPYPHALANGLAFSLPQGMPIPYPCSIRTIYTELKFEYPEFNAPDHGYLMGWASQGVLLLNTWLTVRAGQPGSHTNWEKFTDAVILHLTKNKSGVVFILWGEAAKQKGDIITQGGNPNNHIILKGDHPSPSWANRPEANFYSHDRKTGKRIEQNIEYFKECDRHLGKYKVKWDYLPA